MFLNKNEVDQSIPVYPVEELSMEQALRMLGRDRLPDRYSESQVAGSDLLERAGYSAARVTAW